MLFRSGEVSPRQFALDRRHGHRPRHPPVKRIGNDVIRPNFLGFQKAGEANHGRAMLVIVENRDVDLRLQGLLDLKTTGAGDILEVNPAIGRGNQGVANLPWLARCKANASSLRSNRDTSPISIPSRTSSPGLER